MPNDRGYTVLRVTKKDAAVRVLIDNPPLNLLDATLMRELDLLAAALENDERSQVVVFDSDDPDFFIAHGDMTIVSDPTEFARLPVATNQNADWNPMMRLHERIRTLPQVTIGILRGLARGGGSEFFSALDLRYASLEHAGIGQMEAPTGIVPGAGATAYLPRLIGASRALEVVLSARLIDAATAERWGWVNRAVPEAELDGVVDAIVATVVALAPGVARAAKVAIGAGQPSLNAALDAENTKLGELFGPTAADLTAAALTAGAQTRDGERHLERLLDQVRRTGRDTSRSGLPPA